MVQIRFRRTVQVALCMCAIGLTLPSSTSAQLNVEALATTIKTPGPHALLNSSLSIEAGNVQLLQVQGGAAFVFLTNHPDAPEEEPEGFWFRDRLLANGKAGIKTTQPQGRGGERLANDGYLHLRYTRMQWLKVGFEGFFQIQYDDFQLLSRRVVGGGGFRFVLAHMKNFSTWYGTGYMVEGEKRAIPEEDRPPLGPDPIKMTNHRWNNYLTVLLLQGTERVSIANTVYVQPRFDDPADIQVLDELSVTASLNDVLALTLGFSYRLDTRAPRAVRNFDLQLTQGLTATF